MLAAVKLAGRTDAPDRAKAVTAVIEEVAEILGNTPAVCRASYVDPRVVIEVQARPDHRHRSEAAGARGHEP